MPAHLQGKDLWAYFIPPFPEVQIGCVMGEESLLNIGVQCTLNVYEKVTFTNISCCYQKLWYTQSTKLIQYSLIERSHGTVNSVNSCLNYGILFLFLS
jgi:hypothetical protein